MGSSPSTSTKTKWKTIPIMRLQSPAYRYSQVLEYINAPTFARKRAYPKHFTVNQCSLIDLFKNPTESIDPPVWMAHLIYKMPTACAILSGLLISGEASEVISSIVDTEIPVVESFKEIFFDVSVLQNRLLTVSYIRSLDSATEQDKFHKQMLSWGYYLGSGYISWKLGNKDGYSGTRTPTESVSDVLRDASWRSKEHFLSSITDDQTKEAKAWVPQVLRSAEMLNNIETTKGMENTLAELKIKLEGDDTTTSIEDVLEDIKS